MWKYNNATTANNRVGHGKMGGENAMHLSTGGNNNTYVGGVGEDNIPEYNRIVTDMKMPQIRKQILEQTSSFYVYDRTTQKIVKADLSGYNDVFSPERILYLYNVNALTKSIAYNYTFDDKIRICTQLIVNNKAINDMKRLADYSDNKYVKSMAQSMLNIITNFLDTNLRYIFDRDDVKKDYNEFTGKFTQYNNTIILDLLTTNLQQFLMPVVPNNVGND